MIWLETINIRTGGINDAGKVFETCREIFQSVAAENLLKLRVFSNAKYTTDIGIHFQWSSNPGPASILGTMVSSAIGDLGLISHTLWVEEEALGTDGALEVCSLKIPKG